MNLFGITFPVDIGHKLNVYKKFRRRLLNVLCTYDQFTSCIYGVYTAFP